MPKTWGAYITSSLLKLLLYKGTGELLYIHVTMKWLKIDDVGSPIIIMFTNVIIPAIIFAVFLILGPYDNLIEKVHKKLEK